MDRADGSAIGRLLQESRLEIDRVLTAGLATAAGALVVDMRRGEQGSRGLATSVW
jgi:hypothetical protein